MTSVTEQDRQFSADILDDMGNFEEGITDQEKLAQWVRNIRNAALRSVAQPEYLTGCQLRGPGECQSYGQCQSMSCKNNGKVIVKRVCVEPKEAGIVYPSFAERNLHPLISET